MSKPAKVGTAFVVLTSVVSEVAAIAAYRHSIDGQTGALWGLIILYGLLAIGAIRLVDAAAGRLGTRRARSARRERDTSSRLDESQPIRAI